VANAASPKASLSAVMPLVNKLLASGQNGAKISVKSKIGVKIGARRRKLRAAFGGS